MSVCCLSQQIYSWVWYVGGLGAKNNYIDAVFWKVAILDGVVC